MKFFLHTASRVRIVNGAQEFECPPERFQALEPAYPGLGLATARYWTPERAYLGGLTDYDGHECGQYCERVASYTQYPVIYADVGLSQQTLSAGAPGASILFDAVLKDADGVQLPIDYSWYVRLTHEYEGDIDRILLSFQGGSCSASYVFPAGLPLGTWYLDDSKFDIVTVGGVAYQVLLVNPVEFVVYRSLA